MKRLLLVLLALATPHCFAAEPIAVTISEIAEKCDTVEVSFLLKKLKNEEGNYDNDIWNTIIDLLLRAMVECRNLEADDSHKCLDIMMNALLNCAQLRIDNNTLEGNISLSFRPIEDDSELEDIL